MGQVHSPRFLGRAGWLSLIGREPETYSVSAICGEVRDLLQQAYPSVWVAGEINRIRESRRGHLYFELIEKGDADEIVGKLEAVAWSTDYRQIRTLLAQSHQELAEGQQIRCRGKIDFYAPFGRLQFVVHEVDPVFTLGLLARRRQDTLAALAAAGLLQRNRALTLAPVPLRLGLITSEGSAAYHDFLSSLRESGYGFEVLFVHASVQGRDAEREVESALRLLQRADVECLALVRGGGSRSDLAVFDSRRIAEAIARAPVPVLTGLGHEIDQSIADMMAHTALKTPTKVAEFLVERVAASQRRVAELSGALGQISLAVLRQGRESLGRAERGLIVARYRVKSAQSALQQLMTRLPSASRLYVRHYRRRLGELRRGLAVASSLHVRGGRQQPGLLAERIATRSHGRLLELATRLEGWERLCIQLAPQRTLERGFSITRDSKGRALRDPGKVRCGERIISQLASGSLTSRVEKT